MKELFTVLIVATVSQVYTYVKAHPLTDLEPVPFIACQLYLNKAVFSKGRTVFHI